MVRFRSSPSRRLMLSMTCITYIASVLCTGLNTTFPFLSLAPWGDRLGFDECCHASPERMRKHQLGHHDRSLFHASGLARFRFDRNHVALTKQCAAPDLRSF